MKRILLVKTSSLGDVVHNFPVVSDIRRHFPGVMIDWVVEEAFASLVGLLPGIHRILPVAVRRWRRQPFARSTWREIGEGRIKLGKEHYDAIIDSQGLVKSALIARAARGRRHGFDASSAREPLAARFYDHAHHVDRKLHAVERNRKLAAHALGYRVDAVVDYGLGTAAKSAERSVVLLHSTSRSDKLWPEDSWVKLGRELEREGLQCILPWGGDAERERSERIGGGLLRAVVPGKTDIPGMARMLGAAHSVVGVDTGLVHLAAALGTGVVALYLGTAPQLTGVYGSRRAVNLGGIGERPSVADVLAAVQSL